MLRRHQGLRTWLQAVFRSKETPPPLSTTTARSFGDPDQPSFAPLAPRNMSETGGTFRPLQPLPTTSVIDVAGQPTEVIETVSLVRSKPALEVIVFPGNPGSGQFYISYMRSLHEALMKKVRSAPWILSAPGRFVTLASSLLDRLLGHVDLLLLRPFANPPTSPSPPSLSVSFGVQVGCIRVRTLSHLGHARGVYKPAFYTLEDQVEHKLDFLESYCSDVDAPLLVVGHSIGGYMALEAVKRWQARAGSRRVTRSASKAKGTSRRTHPSDSCRIMALMPYMQFDEDCKKQISLEKLARRPYVPAAVAGFLGLVVPKFLTVRLLTAFDKNLERESAGHVADQLLSYTVGHNAFSLAQDEFRALRGKEIDWGWLRGNKGRIGWVFCPGDHWAPKKLWEQVKGEGAGDFIRFCEDQFHGFCTSARASKGMARLTEEFLGGGRGGDDDDGGL